MEDLAYLLLALYLVGAVPLRGYAPLTLLTIETALVAVYSAAN